MKTGTTTTGLHLRHALLNASPVAGGWAGESGSSKGSFALEGVSSILNIRTFITAPNKEPHSGTSKIGTVAL